MITRGQFLTMGIIYTMLIAAIVAFMENPPAVPIFGVAVAWFSIGRVWERLPTHRNPDMPVRWGRQ